MLLGLVAPSGGQARVLGQLPGHPAAMARVGFLPEHFRFHEWMRAAELLDLHGRLYGMDAAARERRIPEVLELVGLAEHARRTVGDFSKGMLQRIGLAQALLNEPTLVFLDEPTSALDPFGRMLVRGLLHDLKARGTTVFLNSHLLGEVEATCDRVSFIKEGRVLRTVALCDLQAGHTRVELRVDMATPALLAALQSLSTNGVAQLDGAEPGAQQRLELTLDDEEQLPLVAERVLASGARLYALTPQRSTLEQLFLEVVGTQDSGQ
jgi:ABC-2 type transport system ATP-binding protein